MSQEIHVGDVGTILEVTVTDSGVAVNLSSATTKEIFLSKPNGVVITKTAAFVSNGSDGKLQYTTIIGDLDQHGIWKLQVKVALPTGTWQSDIQEFRVYPNLNA